MSNVVLHHYEPLGAFKRVFGKDGRADELLLAGPAGTGKSRCAEEKLHACALKYPGMRGLIMRKTAASLGNTALVTWTKDVAVESLRYGVCSWFGGSQQESAGYRFSNGSKIDVGGIDKPDKIMSSEYDLVYAQEATELFEADWEAVTTRLRNGKMPYQSLMADCNPQHATHWLNQRCAKGTTKMINTRHQDNPRYFNRDGSMTLEGVAYMAKLHALTGVRRLRLLDGIWASAEGVVYDGWNDANHIIEEMPAGWETWPRYWVVDFGYTNPFVLQCWAEDPDGRLYLYREIYHTKRLVEDHVKQIAHIVMENPVQRVNSRGDKEAWTGTWKEPRPRAIICDHDAEDRATLYRHLGISTTAATKTVSDGIQGVQGRLRVAGDSRPRLFILRSCLVERDQSLDDAKKPCSTLEEIPGYIWETGPDGKPLKDKPRKLDDHGCDCIRYIVAEKDLAGRPRVRWMGR
jgi:phage terminase large subunit